MVRSSRAWVMGLHRSERAGGRGGGPRVGAAYEHLGVPSAFPGAGLDEM